MLTLAVVGKSADTLSRNQEWHPPPPQQRKGLLKNVTDEAIQIIIFIKFQPSSRCLVNILCDKMGNTHKASRSGYLKKNTCLSCELTKAV